RVGDPDVQDLPGADRVVQGAHRLLDRGVPVPDVHPVHVQVVGAQPAQALLQGEHQVLPLVAAGVRVVRVAGHGVLAGHDVAVAAPGQHLAGGLLAGPVPRGGVDDVPSRPSPATTLNGDPPGHWPFASVYRSTIRRT